MLVIRPFRGIIYNKDKVQDLGKVVTPPYDVISPLEQEFFYRLHPHNIIRVILGKATPEDNVRENRYTRAAGYFRDWLSRGILKKEKIPSIYVYHQEYHLQNQKIKRKGFIALMKLENFGSGVIFPHEKIFKEPQKDRLNLMRSCRANFSAIFSLFNDSSHQVDKLLEQGDLIFELEDLEGVKHRLSALRDREIINSICCLMEDKKILIADGHHRYLTALKLREELKKKPPFPRGIDYVMMYFLNTESGAATILPVHRLIGGLTPDKLDKLIRGIESLFYKRPFGVSPQREKEDIEKILLEIRKAREPLFGMYRKEEGYSLLLPKEKRFFPEKIKSAILDELIKNILGEERLEKGKQIDFTPSAKEAVKKVREGKFQVAFFLAPIPLEEIQKIAFTGKKLPPKSSYFYPKLLSGLVMRDLEDAIEQLR